MENAAKVTAQEPTEATRRSMARLIALKAMLELNKPIYEEVERLTLDLKDTLGVGHTQINLKESETMFMHNGEVHFLAQNQILTIVDNFSEKNSVFRPACVRRFEASSETAEEFLIRMEKAEKKAAKAAK